MTIRELINQLNQQDQNSTVIVLKSSKNETFVTIDHVEATFWNKDSQQVGIAKLTEKLKKLKYTEKDLLEDPIPSVILWTRTK